MANEKVLDDNEIILNGVAYPIIGSVQPILESNFAEKMVTGDYTKDSLPGVSAWVLSDFRNGILLEEMDESQTAETTQCYWSTCELSFKGHLVPRRLATEITVPASVATAPTITNTDMELDSTWTGGSQEDIIIHAGSHSWSTDGGLNVYQDASNWTTAWQGHWFCFAGWVLTGTASDARLTINDGVGTSYSSYHAGDSNWNWLWVTRKLDASATRLRVGLNRSNADAYFDDVVLRSPSATNSGEFANFNGECYMGWGNTVSKLNSAGDEFEAIYIMPADITDVLSGPNDCLYIFLGDDDEYWYMDTDEDFAETDVTNADMGIVWDSKLFKLDTDGVIYDTTTPNAASPSWNTDGDLRDAGLSSGDANSLRLYRDAAGTMQIYAGTKEGLFSHDFDNDVWIATELALPRQTTTGMGFVHWREYAYLSAGLGMAVYSTGEAGTSIGFAGLDLQDGLPTGRGGEIVKLIKGFNEIFALVDSTYEGSSSRSTVMAYDGNGWQCWWEAGSNNLAMYTGIVTTKARYSLIFRAGTSVYWLPLQSNIRNPKKVSTFTYEAAAIHISPWFDANWQLGTKLALQLNVFCKDTTANETVVVKYRTDHANTDIDTGWTTLGTIAAAGDGVETEYTFGSSLGENFKSIQFRFDLARGGTSTNCPDVLYATLYYQKIIPPVWGWQVTIDCTKQHKGKSPEQLLAAVKTAAELETLTPFIYDDDSGTQYVRVMDVRGAHQTGSEKRGTYNVLVVTPI